MNSSVAPLDIKNLKSTKRSINAEEPLRTRETRTVSENPGLVKTGKQMETRFMNPAAFVNNETEDMEGSVDQNKDSGPCNKRSKCVKASFAVEQHPTAPSTNVTYRRVVAKVPESPASSVTSIDLMRLPIEPPNNYHSLSLTSLSTVYSEDGEDSGSEENRRQRYEEWLRRKHEKFLLQKQIEREKQIQQENQDQAAEQQKVNIRKENFDRWLKKKREVKDKQKSLKVLEIERAQREKLRKEKQTAEIEIRIREWELKKRSEHKVQKAKEREEAAKAAEQKAMRLKLGEEAFRKWMMDVHKKPKYVPLNKGELGVAKHHIGFVNPVPWSYNTKEKTTGVGAGDSNEANRTN